MEQLTSEFSYVEGLMVKLKHLKEARCVLVLYFWHQISRINSEMAY